MRELIGGAKRLHVELAARVLNARRGHGKGLELGVVRGGGDLRAAGADVLDDRDGEAAPSTGSVPAPSSSKRTRNRRPPRRGY